MQRQEFLVRTHLDANVLEAWVAEGWLFPLEQGGDDQFSEIDLARVHLIHDLKGNIGVNDEGIAVILHLLDQLHGMRQALGDFLSTMRTQPADLRERIAAHLNDAAPGNDPQT
jgi:chaperone modulatory protein CbpM